MSACDRVQTPIQRSSKLFDVIILPLKSLSKAYGKFRIKKQLFTCLSLQYGKVYSLRRERGLNLLQIGRTQTIDHLPSHSPIPWQAKNAKKSETKLKSIYFRTFEGAGGCSSRGLLLGHEDRALRRRQVWLHGGKDCQKRARELEQTQMRPHRPNSGERA